MKAADTSLDPVGRIVAAIEASFDRVVATAVDAIWEQVPAYPACPEERLRDDVTMHVGVIFRVLLASLREGRPVQRADFPVTESQAVRRIRQGISLSDFLHASQVGQLTFWGAVLDAAGDDSRTRDAALSLVEQVMQGVDVGTSVGAEMYLYAQQHQLAESDRIRRDLLEDLLARRDVPPGPKQAMLRAAGLEPGVRLVVASGRSALPLADDRTLQDAVTVLRRLASQGFTVVRQDEIVGIAPVPAGGSAAAVKNLQRVIPDLERQGWRFMLGISTVHAGLAEVPEAYAEACAARDGLGGTPGVVALPLLSSLDYLVLRHDETARRLIRPEVYRFVEEDLARGGDLIATFLEYTASNLNAKIAAQRLHMHANTAYYRLERIAERTGCDLRRFADVVELLIAVRLLNGHGAQRGRTAW
jgi:hypothetical protein